jgi:predicted ATPase/DNA-binding SARP family transcriptional activator
MRLAVRLLGVVEVVLDGERLHALDSLRLQRFLALIALRRDAQHRSRIAFELWPDSDESQARTNLRKLLHEFRHALPDVEQFVEIEKETVCWITTRSSEVDVQRFRDAIAAGDLELASRIYSGDFLPACYDDWVLEERAKLHTEALGVLVQLAEESAEREDHKATLKHTQRILDLEPTDETAVRLQMEAHLDLDEKSAALRCYHRYSEVLERDLGLVPGQEIENLYRQLHTGESRQEKEAVKSLALAAESPFVGREREWRQVTAAWDNARLGRARLVLLTGEPGIGKSRLALELGRSIRRDGHLVASARAYEAAGRLPWGPIVELLRSEALRDQIAMLDSLWKAELARLLPELGDVALSSRSDAAGDKVQRHRLFDAVREALLAGDRPRMLIIDDLQWCDIETIELIGFLVRSRQSAPVLVVGTVRDEELSDKSALTGLISALDREQLATTIPLERLDQAATEALASELRSVQEFDRELAAKLWRETEGNPLFVIETVRAGLPSDGGPAVLTPTMRSVLHARMEQLTDGARRLVDIAAVVGRRFSIPLLAAASGKPEDELVDDIDELWRRRIIRDHGQAYDFSHDKLRAVARDAISPARRRQLHRAVAEAIAREYAGDAEAAAPQLAAHYDYAGMANEAVEAYRVAGERAVSVSALDEAVTMLRRALSLLGDMAPSRTRDKLELQICIALGSPLVALDGYGAASSHRLYERALRLCRKLNQPIDAPILRGLGLARLQGCRFADCDELAQALLDIDSQDAVTRTEGHYLLGVSAFWQGDLEKARDHLESAIAAYDVTRQAEHLAFFAQDPRAVCLVRLALVEQWASDSERAEQLAREALQVATNIDHPMTLAYVITYAAILAAEAGESEWLAELLADAQALRERLSERYLVVILDALRGWLEVSQGSLGGIDKILRAVGRSRAEGETLHLTYALLLLARARLQAGEMHEGRVAAGEALEWTRESNQRYLEAELSRLDADLAQRGGESS